MGRGVQVLGLRAHPLGAAVPGPATRRGARAEAWRQRHGRLGRLHHRVRRRGLRHGSSTDT